MPEFEYERKFLVRDPSVTGSEGGAVLKQGYFGVAEGYSFRVRFSAGLAAADGDEIAVTHLATHISESGYSMALKGPRKGIARREAEWSLTVEDGELALKACEGYLIEKVRHPVLGPDGQPWTIDVFSGLNAGLVLAEFETNGPGGAFLMPDWCGDDVTEDERYYNDYLSRVPFSTWPES